MNIIIGIIIFGVLVFILSRPKIRLIFYSFIDPVSGKEIRKLGYKLVYIKKDIRELKKGQVAIIRKNPETINPGDLVYVKKKFWIVLAINREEHKVKLEGNNKEIQINQIDGLVVGKEEL